MKVPEIRRIRCCADMVPAGALVADVGCDHGYLGIQLLLEGRASFVYASDLNKMPLESARKNAERFGVSQRMHFVCASGLDGIDPSQVDTIVCAGMGGDLMRKILTAAPWVRDEKYTLILQPQSGAADFRKWLFAEGFSLMEENPIWEDGHMYFVMKLRHTGIRTEVTPGQLYLTQQMLRSGSEDLPRYIQGVLDHLDKTINGMRMAARQHDKLDFYLLARQEITEMRDHLGKGI